MSGARDVLLISAFGSVIRAARTVRKLTQEELSFAAGLDRTYIAMLEAGKRQPTLSVISALAKALGTLPEELLKSARLHPRNFIDVNGDPSKN